MRTLRWALVSVVVALASCGNKSASISSDASFESTPPITEVAVESKIDTSIVESLLRKIIEISEVQGVPLNDGNDLPVIGQCPMGLESDWGAEATGTVFCLVDLMPEDKYAVWVFTIDEVSVSEMLEAAGDVVTGEFAGGEEQFACGSSNGDGLGRCAVLWKSGNFKALYVGAPGALSDEVRFEFHKNLVSFIATFESWDPSDSLFQD